jgi:hypothetical protein
MWTRLAFRGPRAGRFAMEHMLFSAAIVLGMIFGGRAIGRGMMAKYRDAGEMLGHGRIYEPGLTVASAKVPGGNPGGGVNDPGPGGGNPDDTPGDNDGDAGDDVGGTDPCASCTDWQDKACGGNCPGQMEQVRACGASGCAKTSQCVDRDACKTGGDTQPDPPATEAECRTLWTEYCSGCPKANECPKDRGGFGARPFRFCEKTRTRRRPPPQCTNP